MVPMAPTSIPSLPEDVAPSSLEMASSSPATHGHGEGLPVVNPPPSNAPMVFRFKSQRERDGMVAPPMEPNAPMEPSEGPPPPLVQGPKRERRHRPDEAAAIQDGPTHHLPSLTDDPGLIFDLDWDAWYAKCPTWQGACEKIQNEMNWPGGFQCMDGKAYFESKL